MSFITSKISSLSSTANIRCIIMCFIPIYSVYYTQLLYQIVCSKQTLCCNTGIYSVHVFKRRSIARATEKFGIVFSTLAGNSVRIPVLGFADIITLTAFGAKVFSQRQKK